jgi:hypothetical protein
MATYLQGVTDYIPDYQPFQPDLNFYNNVLQTKQTQYDTNWKAVNNLYAELHNSDLTHDQNVKKKDDLLKQIDFNLKRVTGLDLSLEQNVDQATQVFRPFYEDKYLMKDMAWTKNYNGTLSRALNLQNSQDEKMQKQFWGIGIKEMQFRKQEFKDATLDQTLNMGNVTYTPYVDALEKYRKLAKDSGISIDIKDVDETGMYFIHEKNGKRLTATMQNLFMSAYANDPALQARYGTEAYVKRKEYAEQQATKFNGNKTEAEKEYLRDQYTFLQNYTAKQNNKNQEKAAVTTNKVTASANAIEKQDANPYTESYLESLNKALQIDQTVADHSAKLNETFNVNNDPEASANGANQSTLDLNNLELARLKVDSGTASLLAEQHILTAADAAAMVDYKYEKSVNPIGLENLNHKHSLERIAYNHQLRQEDIKLKAAQDRETERIKKGIADGTMFYDKNGTLHEDPGITYAATLGSTSGQVTDEINILKDNANKNNKVISDLTGTYIGNTLTTMRNLISGSKKELSQQEVWNALSFLDPNSKEASTRYGTKNGYEMFNKLWNKYQTNPDKFILEFSKTGQVLKLKKFMDKWSNDNYGHRLAVQYKGDVAGKDIEKFVRFKESAAVVDKHNYTKISNGLIRALDSEPNFSKLKDETKQKIVDIYIKNLKSGQKAEKGKSSAYGKERDESPEEQFQRFLDQQLGYQQYATKRKQSQITSEYTVDKYEPYKSGFTKKTGIKLDNLYKAMDKAYLNTINQTGPDGLLSYTGYVRTKGGRYALASNDVTARDVNLSNPSWGGFKDFQEIMADINRIKFSQDPSKYAVTIGGLTKSAAANSPMSPLEAKALLRELQLSAVGKKTTTGKFTIARAPIAMENQNLAAMIVVPPQEFLTKYIKDADGKPDWAKIKLIKQNGISFIAPKSQWTNNFYLQNEPTPTEMLLNAKGKIEYVHGNKAGEYTIEKVKNVPGVDYRMDFVGYKLNPDGTIKEDKNYLLHQKSGNKIDDTESEIYDVIQKINEQNMLTYKEIQRRGDQAAIKKAQEFFRNPSYMSYNY